MIHSLIPHWKQIRTLPQTYILLGTLSFYYAVFLYFLGFNLWASILGLAIALITWIIWNVIIPPKITAINQRNQANLLLKASFEDELKQSNSQIYSITEESVKQQWRDALEIARSIYGITEEINRLNPSFLTELLETLHLVINIYREIVACSIAKTNVKDSSASRKVEQRLTLKQSQLLEIHQTASQLRDKLIVSGLSLSESDSEPLKDLLDIVSEEEEMS